MQSALALFLVTSLPLAAIASPSAAHGAIFPPSSGGGSSGPSGPPPQDPGGAPGPGSPRPPPAATPASPSGPSTPTVGGPQAPSTPGGSGRGGGPSTFQPSAQDLADWSLWWTFHRDEFLELKSALAQGAGLVTGEEALFGRSGASAAAPPDTRKLHDVVVPALLAALKDERNPDVLTASMLALAKIGRGPSVVDAAAIEAALIPFLADPVQEVGETAALALGLNATVSAAPALAALAAGDERGRLLAGQLEVPYRTRAYACYGLGLLGIAAKNPDVRRFAVHHLVQVYENDKGGTRDVKTAVLVALGLLPLAPMHASDGGPTSPSSSCEADLSWLLAVWRQNQESELVRAYAATSAARLAAGAPAAIADAWKEALCDAIEPVSSVPAVLKQSAAMALGALADNDDDPLDVRARGLLQRAAKDAEGLARRFAAISLARCAARDGHGAGGTDNLIAARRFLLGELEGGSSVMRPWIALALGVGEALRMRAGLEASDEVRAALVKGLERHKSPGEAGAWCIAAGLAHAQSAREPLVEWAAGNQESAARPHAALALGLLGWDGAVLALRKAVQDARYRPLVLRDASIALGLLGSTDNVVHLTQMLDDSQGLTSLSAIASALSYVGDARAVDPLLALLKRGERPDRVRAFAAAALGGLCDRDVVPWNAEIARMVNYWVPPATLYEPAAGTGILDLL